MDRQRDWRLDPRLAEEFADRQERGNVRNQQLLARQGDIAAHGIERMGDILSQGMKEGYQNYRTGKRDKIDENFDKIKYDRLRAEDEYWNGPWDGANVGGGAGPGMGSPGGVPNGNAGGATVSGAGIPDAGTIRQGAGGMAEDDQPRTVTFKPEQSFSPGAVAVLEGRAKPGVNPAIRGVENPTTRYLKGETTTPQYLGLDRQSYGAPAPGGSNSSPATNPALGSTQLGVGAGFGTAGNGQNVPRETFYFPGEPIPGKTRLQHKWDLGLAKSEEEINQMRRGQTGRNAPWINTGKFDAQGHPIKFNQMTGDFAIDTGVTGATPKDPGAATDYQLGQLELGKERNQIARDAAKNKTGKGPASLTPYQQYQMERNQQLDQYRREDKKEAAATKAKEKLEGKATKYSEEVQQTGVHKSLAQLENIHGIMDKNEDIPGFGQTAALPDLMVSKEGQDLRQSVKTLFNIELKDRSGAAVVDQELNRLKEEFGQGNWKTDRQLREGIRQYEARLHEVIRNMNAGVDSAVIDEYAARGGRDMRTYQAPAQEKWIKGKRYTKVPGGWAPAGQ